MKRKEMTKPAEKKMIICVLQFSVKPALNQTNSSKYHKNHILCHKINSSRKLKRIVLRWMTVLSNDEFVISCNSITVWLPMYDHIGLEREKPKDPKLTIRVRLLLELRLIYPTFWNTEYLSSPQVEEALGCQLRKQRCVNVIGMRTEEKTENIHSKNKSTSTWSSKDISISFNHISVI